jgi:acyl carrier protein
MKSVEKDGLEAELIEMIIEVCNITDPVPEDLSPNDPLIGPESALGLDSLDAVEIVVAVEKKYNIRIGSQESSRKIFRSLRTLANYIKKHRSVTRP